jgi:hypothetical protein
MVREKQIPPFGRNDKSWDRVTRVAGQNDEDLRETNGNG